jgi:hypothetical protein
MQTVSGQLSTKEREDVMRLSREGQERARQFLFEQGRPLERALYGYYFGESSLENILSELVAYQNPDGGCGYALEPDVRLPGSSVLATTIAFQILRELRVGAGHPLVQGAIRYLLDTYEARHGAWPIVPEGVNRAPRAPWWGYGGDEPSWWEGCLNNPRPEVVGYLYDYALLVPREFLADLFEAVIARLDVVAETMEMHDLLCYARFARSRALPEDTRARVLGTLSSAVDRLVAREPADWDTYGLKPLTLVDSPDSPFAGMLADEVARNLDYEIERQGEDGAWAPNWSWGDAYPEAWQDAKREWSGVITLETLRRLQSFGRLQA